MKSYKLAVASLMFTFYACMGCTSDLADGSENSEYTGEEVSEPNEEDIVEDIEFNKTVSISFSAASAEVSNAASGVSIAQTGANIVITSSVEGVEYILSGTTTAGSVKIYSDYKLKLTLNNVNITSASGPAINVQSHKRIFVDMPAGTTNALTDSKTYPASGDEDQKACLFSEGQLIFSGEGKLTVKGNYKHGICSDDYVIVRQDVGITVSGDAGDGLHANEYILIEGGTINITSVDEGICAEEGSVVVNNGKINITTTGLSAKGIKGLGNVSVNGGSIYVLAKGGEGSEGIESKAILTINDGLIEVETYDDCLNAANAIVINGGTIYCYSSNNDAVDSNGTLTVTGGLIIASGTQSPEEGFDCDNNTFKITGGTLVGVGGATSSPTANACTQYSLVYGGSGTAGQYINIQSAAGADILTYKLPRTYSQMTLLFSSPQLAANGSYIIYSGGTVSGGTDFHGYNTDGTYAGGSQLSTFTASSIVTQIGNISGPGGGGQQPGGGPR